MKYDLYEKGKIQCLICFKWFKKPCSHVTQKHNLTARQYKEQYGLDVKKGILKKESRILASSRVTEKSLENLKKGIPYRFKKGVSNNYKRSEQSIKRLKKQFL